MEKPELVVGYLMNGGAFIQSIKVPKLLDWIKHLEPEELIAFFQDLLELVIQIPRGKEDVEALEEFLAYWRELALEAESAFEQTHSDPADAEIAAKAVDILWKSLADSIGAAMSSGELGIFRDYDEAERELMSPLIDIVDEQPGRALTTQGTHMEPEPEVIDVTKQERDHYLAQSIFGIGLSTRVCNCLARENIETVRELVIKTEWDLLEYTDFGQVSLLDVKKQLAARGLYLGMDLDDKDYEKDEDIYEEEDME
ncbi:hypothetical protein F4054_01750 [Candidatus Poribacteria bacterium]|nr:hypothetical protein [Candidatus Poribacteria bacterium]MYG08032.1 hypothetical protein [Candidatus Poribacteria bacterium]MYK20965.1 hypothetical protein [Candidatus Poribacteria bacterium]